MSGMISIVVPVYKVPHNYLNKCIESLISQTYKNIEIILVDDGSPDDCGDICDDYAKKDSRIKVLHKENGGLSSARNSGVENARGDFVIFVDGDDWIEPETCEVLFQEYLKTNTDLVMFGMVRDFNGTLEKYKYKLTENHYYDKKECLQLQKYVLDFNSNISTATTKLIKREVLISNTIKHNESLKQGAEGIVFNLQLFEAISSATFIDKPFYHYIYNNESISTTYNERNIDLVLECFKYIYEYIRQTDERKTLLLATFWTRISYMIITTVISGYYNPANNDSFNVKKKKCNSFLNDNLIQMGLRNCDYKELSTVRRITFFCIKSRMFVALNIMAIIRKWQKSHK